MPLSFRESMRFRDDGGNPCHDPDTGEFCGDGDGDGSGGGRDLTEQELKSDRHLGKFERDPDAPEGTVRTNVPFSPYSHTGVERQWQTDYEKFKSEDVPVSSIRATQDWVYPGYDPDMSAGSEPIHGVKTPDGLVHISDGHHRTWWAKNHGEKTVKAKVATTRDLFGKVKPKGDDAFEREVRRNFMKRLGVDPGPLLLKKGNGYFKYLLGRDGGGNPCHDPDTGEFCDDGGGAGSSDLKLTPSDSKPIDEKPQSKFGRYEKLSVERTQVGAVRAAVQDKLPEAYAIDVAGSMMEHGNFPLSGQGFDFERSLKKEGLDVTKLETYTDAQIYDALKKDPKILSGTGYDGKKGSDSGHSQIGLVLERSITSKKGQEHVSDIMLKAGKEAESFKPSGNTSSAMTIAMTTAARKYRGDIVDKLADGLPADEVKKTPLQMFMKGYADFLPDFVNNWTFVGGNTSYRRSYAAINKDLVNESVPKFWMGKTPLTESEQVPSKNLKENLLRLHDKTQEFYKKKLKTDDLSTKTITIQRGIGGHADEYTPAPVESWTVDKRTPERFGILMSGNDNKYSVLTATVPVSSILMSWESLKGTWPAEKDVKGKKEVVVLGGALHDIVNEKKIA